MTLTANVIYFLFLSATAAGLLLAVAYVAYNPQDPTDESDRLIVGGTFITGCALCISMTLYPNWPRVCAKRQVYQQTEEAREMPVRRYVAHHPDCDNFRNHRIAVGDVEFCSGCLGLMIGSVASVALMVAYIFLMNDRLGGASNFIVAVGFCALSFALFVSLLRARGPFFNVFANTLMVPGLFLLTVGLLEITGNLYAGLMVVLFSFLWANTRIQLSQWRHSMTCKKCASECKMY